MAIRKYQGISPLLAERVFVDRSAVVIGDVELGEDSSVWPFALIRGDMHRIRIGARTSVQDGSVLHITHAGPFNPDGYPLIIGAGSLVPPGKVLESGYLYVGSPVKQARTLTDKERTFFSYSAANYVKLKDLHLAEGYDQAE